MKDETELQINKFFFKNVRVKNKTDQFLVISAVTSSPSYERSRKYIRQIYRNVQRLVLNTFKPKRTQQRRQDMKIKTPHGI